MACRAPKSRAHKGLPVLDPCYAVRFTVEERRRLINVEFVRRGRSLPGMNRFDGVVGTTALIRSRGRELAWKRTCRVGGSSWMRDSVRVESRARLFVELSSDPSGKQENQRMV